MVEKWLWKLDITCKRDRYLPNDFYQNSFPALKQKGEQETEKLDSL